MDKLNHYRSLIQKVLEEYHKLSSGNSHIESALLLDPIRDQYLLLKMGWHQDFPEACAVRASCDRTQRSVARYNRCDVR